MKQVFLAAAFATACATLLGAQSQTSEVKTKTTIKVKEGQNVTLTGCLQRTDDATGYILTNIIGEGVHMTRYRLIDDDRDDLEERVGYRVEVTGKAGDRDGSKIEAESKTETKVNGEKTSEQQTKGEAEGPLKDLAFLGVKSVKTISKTCS